MASDNTSELFVTLSGLMVVGSGTSNRNDQLFNLVTIDPVVDENEHD